MTVATRILVCGSRNWTDEHTIHQALAWTDAALVNSHLEILHGDCEGADRIAGQAATHSAIPVRAFPADWDKHGKAAGPIRNAAMLELGKPHCVFCFSTAYPVTKGSADMCRRASEAGVPVLLWVQGREGIRYCKPTGKSNA